MKFAIALDIPKGANDRPIKVVVPALKLGGDGFATIDEAKREAVTLIEAWCSTVSEPVRDLGWSGSEYPGWAWSEVEADVDRFFKETE